MTKIEKGGLIFITGVLLMNVGCHRNIEGQSSTVSLSFEFHSILFKPSKPQAGDLLADALVDNDQMRKLKESAEVLKEISVFQVEIRGATDNIECKDADCYDLSTRRARMIYDWLRGHGVPSESLYAFRGFAIENPISSNKDEEERQRSRRVEFGVIRTSYGRGGSLIDNVEERQHEALDTQNSN